MVQHRVRRRVPVVPATVHLTARDHIDPSDLLFEDGSLRGSQLRVREIALGELPERDQPIQGFVPARHAMRADHSGGVRCDIAASLTSLAEESRLCGPAVNSRATAQATQWELPRPNKK